MENHYWMAPTLCLTATSRLQAQKQVFQHTGLVVWMEPTVTGAPPKVIELPIHERCSCRLANKRLLLIYWTYWNLLACLFDKMFNSVLNTDKAIPLWRMIWAKSTYRNDSLRNRAVAGFWPIRERIRTVARYPATARCLIAWCYL